MTPDLKIACELVFQEHKMAGQPIKWGRDAFRGKISFGLSEMAKETLVKKKIILLPDKSKKVFTQLNPDVAAAGSFEEAEKMIETKISAPAVTLTTIDTDRFPGGSAVGVAEASPAPHSRYVRHVSPAPVPVAAMSDVKWWMKPLFLYIVWPVCGAAAGALISLLMDVASTELFLSLKQ